MPDNAFTIGAIVNVADVQAGMTSAGEVTREALDKMMADFQEASTGTARAVAKISEDTRTAAVEVESSWKRVAQASLAYTSALKEVSAATYLARKAGEDDAAATNLLAAAKQRAAAASSELAAAQAAAREQSGLFASLSGVFESVQGSLVAVAAAAATAYEAMHRFNEASEFLLQMRNLSTVTHISAESLAGLHDVVKEMGGDFDAVSVGLSKMLKAQEDAVAGSAKQVQGFKLIGLSVNDIKSLSPEELLFRVADGFDKTGSAADKNAAAIDIFGKGGRALIAVFEVLGPMLREHVEEAGKVSGVTDRNIAAAQSWTSITEQLSVSMRKLAEDSLPVLFKAIAGINAAMEGLGAVLQTIFESIGTVIVGVVEGIVGLGKLLNDVVHRNFSALSGDAVDVKNNVVGTFKGGAKDIEEAWTSVGKRYSEVLAQMNAQGQFAGAIPKKPGDDTPTGDGKDTRLADWKAELQAKKDDEDGFHQLSKDDEAAFWTEKLGTVQAGTKLYGEVLHEVRDAERASDKESLKDELDAVREKLAATKSGSAERVAILSEEVSHLKSIGADQTEDYKRLQTQLVAATREFANEQGKAAVEAERQKVEGTRKGSEERVAAERAVLAELAALGLQETAEYTKQQQRVVDAARQAAQERMKLQELDIEQARVSGVATVQVQRQSVQAEFDLHRINAQQRVTALKQLEDEEYEITKTALEKKLALMQQDPTLSPVQIKQLQLQIENLTREHNDKIAALNTQAVKDSEQKYDQMWAHINSGFQSAINGMLTGTKTFARGMADLWNSLVTGIIDSIAKMALQWIEQHLLMRAFSAIFHTQEQADDIASKTAQTAETSAANVAVATSDAAVAAAGALAWWSAVNPFIAPEMAAATYAEGMTFAGLAAFHGGGIAGEEQLAILKRNEMVLDPVLSSGFQQMLGGGGGPAAPAVSSSGGAGSGISFGDVHYSPTNNYPSSPGQDGAVIAKMVQKRISRKLGITIG